MIFEYIMNNGSSKVMVVSNISIYKIVNRIKINKIKYVICLNCVLCLGFGWF